MNYVMKYQNALNKVSEVTPLLVGETLNELKRNSEEFMQEVQDAQYIKVPLVGVYLVQVKVRCSMYLQRRWVCYLSILCQKQLLLTNFIMA